MKSGESDNRKGRISKYKLVSGYFRDNFPVLFLPSSTVWLNVHLCVLNNNNYNIIQINKNKKTNPDMYDMRRIHYCAVYASRCTYWCAVTYYIIIVFLRVACVHLVIRIVMPTRRCGIDVLLMAAVAEVTYSETTMTCAHRPRVSIFINLWHVIKLTPPNPVAAITATTELFYMTSTAGRHWWNGFRKNTSVVPRGPLLIRYCLVKRTPSITATTTASTAATVNTLPPSQYTRIRPPPAVDDATGSNGLLSLTQVQPPRE